MKSELQNMINDCSAEIADIEVKLQALQPFDKEVRYLTNYALIKASGTVEVVYRSIIADHFSQLSNSRIDTYLDAAVRNGQMSAKYEQMCNLLQKFDPGWRDSFRTTVSANPDGQRMISASNSLVTNRHAFAHGKNPTATFQDIKSYYQDVLQLITIFDSVVC